MAAPNDTIWGGEVTTSSNAGRVGIARTWTDYPTFERATVQVWFWSKYAVSDTSNRCDLAVAIDGSNQILVEGDTSSISHTSGTAWSSNNQTLLVEYTIDLPRRQGDYTVLFNCSFQGIENLGQVMYAQRNYTVYSLESHTVTYDANGGTNAPDSQTKWYGEILTLSSQYPTRTGYTFFGWGTSASATVATYPAGGQYGTDADIKLYAVWKPNQYTITFDSNGGDVNEDSKTVVYNSAYDELPIPTKTGYTFINWYTEEGTIVTEDTIVNISSDHTLFASWEANTYVITLNPNGGEVVVDSLEVVYETIQNNNISQYIPVRQAYEFLGWYDANGIQVYDANGLCTNDGTYWLNDVCVYTEDFTLYAQWKALNIAYYKHEGEWKLCRTYIKVNDIWKPAIMYTKSNNKYIR